jgi:hypothetical protein
MSDPERGAMVQTIKSVDSLSIFSSVKWVLTTLGVSGILLATGFVSDFSYQDRLGYQLSGAADALTYSIEAGRFFVSVATLTLSWIFIPSHLVAILGIACVAVIAGSIQRRYLPPWAGSTSHDRVGAITVISLLVLKMMLFDMPTVALRAALIHPVLPPEANGRLSESLTRDFWEDETCSRIEVDPHYAKLRSISKGACLLIPSEYKHRKMDRFAVNVLLTAGLFFAGMRQLLMEWRPASGHGMMVLLVFLMVMTLLMLPYVYSKTVRLTTADDVKVTWTASGQSGVREGAPGFPLPGVVPGNPIQTNFNLLYKNNNEVVLFDPNEGHIWVMPRNEVRMIRIMSESDVVKFLIRKRLNEVRLSVGL